MQPCRPFVTGRTLIGGPAHQTRNGSDLCEILVIAIDLTGAFRLPPASDLERYAASYRW